MDLHPGQSVRRHPALSVHFPSATCEEVRAQVVDALEGEGFGVINEVDLRALVHQTIGRDLRPYFLVSVLNPVLAHEALSADPDSGLRLPWTVCIFDDGSGVTVSVARQDGTDSPARGAFEQAQERLRNALATVDLSRGH